MTVTVAYIEDGILYLAPGTVPWAYEEGGTVFVREFPPVLTVGESITIRLPADGPLTYEVWGERPHANVGAPGGLANLSGVGHGSALSAPGAASQLTLHGEEADLA